MLLTFLYNCTTILLILAYAFDEELKKKLLKLYNEYYKQFSHFQYCLQQPACLTVGLCVLEICTGISELKFEYAAYESFLYLNSTLIEGDSFFPSFLSSTPMTTQ